MHMRGNLFWGSVLVILAALLLLRMQGIIDADIWGYFWPLVMMLIGIWLIASAFADRRPIEGEHVSIPLEGAGRARIMLNHGAGRMGVKCGAPAGELLSGSFSGGLGFATARVNDELQVEMKSKPHFWLWGPGESLDWEFALNHDVLLSLHVKSGADRSTLDLSDLNVTDLRLETGASSTELTLPRAGQIHVEVSAGAASVEMRVPQGVAARIRVKSGIASLNIDKTRFPRIDSDTYQSADYAASDNRADILIEAGVGSIKIV